MSPKSKTMEVVHSDQTFTPEQIELIKNTIAKGATNDELNLFLYTCKRTGLDPLTKQIYFVKRSTKQPDGSYRDQMTIQTGIDGYRAIAERTGTLAGIDDAVFDSDTAITPKKASVTVFRMVSGQRVGFTASARWAEYCQPQGFMWKKMPYLMLGKCAESLALRKAFPNDLSGLYTNEEMAQADSIPEHKEVEVIDAPVEKKLSKEETEKLEIVKLCTEIGLTTLTVFNTKEDYEKFVKEKTGFDLKPEFYNMIITRLKSIKSANEFEKDLAEPAKT